MIILVKYSDNMKKQILSFITSLAIPVLFFTNCKKEDSPPPPSKTNTQRMSESPWKFSTAFAGSTDVSNLPQLTCFKDNILTFSINLTGSINEGTNICSPSTAGAFTWNFASNETIVHISTVLISGGNNDFTLVALTDTQLKVSQVINAQTVVVTFIH